MSNMAASEWPPNGDSRRPARRRKRGADSLEELQPIIRQVVRTVFDEELQPIIREVEGTVLPNIREVVRTVFVEQQQPVIRKVTSTCLSKDEAKLMIGEMVKQEVSKALKLELPAYEKRTCKGKMEALTAECLRLKFINKPSTPIYTRTQVEGTPIEGESSEHLQLALFDANGNAVTSGPESSMEVLLELMQGHFESSENSNWEYFKQRGKRGEPLLEGGLTVKFNQGKGVVSNLIITDNSSRSPNRHFRLAAAVAGGRWKGVRVEEAITDPFRVTDRRQKSRMKHSTPHSNDEVWRLCGISKYGKFHLRLETAKIETVGDFVKALREDPHRLKTILGMTNHAWRATVEHADKCITSSNISAPQLNPLGNISQATEYQTVNHSIQAGDEQHSAADSSLCAPINSSRNIHQDYEEWLAQSLREMDDSLDNNHPSKMFW